MACEEGLRSSLESLNRELLDFSLRARFRHIDETLLAGDDLMLVPLPPAVALGFAGVAWVAVMTIASRLKSYWRVSRRAGG